MLRRSLALPLAVLSLTTAGCGGGPGDTTLPTGRATNAWQAVVAARTAQVPLPSGVLDLGISAPASSADARISGKLVAAKGSHLVGLTWSMQLPDDAYLHSVLTGAQLGPAGSDPRVSLVSGSRSYRLPAMGGPKLQRGSVYVAVPDAGRPRLEVSYDGRVQSVDLATGSAAAGPDTQLRGPEAEHTTAIPCDAARFFPHDTAASCNVERWFDVSYVDQLGWAHNGKTWVVVDLQAAGDPRIAVDGTSATRSLPSGGAAKRLAFQVASSGPHTLRLTFPGGTVQSLALS